jgi:hypothetical protein
MRSTKDEKQLIISNGKGAFKECKISPVLLKPKRPPLKINKPIHKQTAMFFHLEKLTTYGLIKVETNFKIKMK